MLFKKQLSTLLHLGLIGYQATEENVSHVNTLNSKEEEYFWETCLEIPKNFEKRMIQMTHCKYTEGQERGSIKTVIVKSWHLKVLKR